MNRILKSALLACLTAAISTAPIQCWAQQQRQNRGNVDPAQARERMMERYREQLEIKNDSEWSAIEPRIQKVLDARRDLQSGVGMAMARRARGGADNAQTDQAQGTRRGRRGNNNNSQGDQPQATRRGPQPSAAAQSLQQAVTSNAAADEVKTKLASYREERQQKRAKLETAQTELQKVFSVRQEATAVLMGLLQ
jgi:hypothetical protein